MYRSKKSNKNTSKCKIWSCIVNPTTYFHFCWTTFNIHHSFSLSLACSVAFSSSTVFFLYGQEIRFFFSPAKRLKTQVYPKQLPTATSLRWKASWEALFEFNQLFSPPSRLSLRPCRRVCAPLLSSPNSLVTFKARVAPRPVPSADVSTCANAERHNRSVAVWRRGCRPYIDTSGKMIHLALQQRIVPRSQRDKWALSISPTRGRRTRRRSIKPAVHFSPCLRSRGASQQPLTHSLQNIHDDHATKDAARGASPTTHQDCTKYIYLYTFSCARHTEKYRPQLLTVRRRMANTADSWRTRRLLAGTEGRSIT